MSAAEQLSPTFTEAQAAKRLGISKATLTRDRNAGKVRPMRYGQRIIRYTDAILIEYQELCRIGLDKSATSGSANDPAPPNGAEHGTTPTLGRRDAHRLAQATFKRRS